MPALLFTGTKSGVANLDTEISPKSDRTRAIVAIVVAIITGTALVMAAVVPVILNNSKENALAIRETAIAQTQTVITSRLTQIAHNVTPEPVPHFLKQLTVPSNTDKGVVYEAQQPGTYIFQYTTGAFSAWEGGSDIGRWTSYVLAFLGNEALFDGDSPRFDLVAFAIGGRSEGGYNSKEEAISAGIGSKASIKLEANQQLTFIVSDGRFSFGDNSGEVVIDVFFVP